jgi:polyisoprenoid-binding protein YceI
MNQPETGAGRDDANGQDELGGRWTLDPEATSASFDTKAMWILKVHGTIRATEGSAQIDADGQIRAGHVVFDASSIDTGQAKRDTHLRTDDFFSADQFGAIAFDVTGAQQVDGQVGDGTVELHGTLTIRDQTRPLDVRAEVHRDGDKATVTTAFDIDRRDWGLTWAKMGASTVNHVTVQARFSHDDAGA